MGGGHNRGRAGPARRPRHRMKRGVARTASGVGLCVREGVDPSTASVKMGLDPLSWTRIAFPFRDPEPVQLGRRGLDADYAI